LDFFFGWAKPGREQLVAVLMKNLAVW